MKNNLDLILNGPVLKMICKLSLPNSITGISMVLIVISDAYFVSKLGNVSLASLALVFPFITLMQMMSAGAIGGASTSSISRFLGANLIESANSAIWHAVLIGISMSIIYSVIFVLFPKYIFMSMGADQIVAGWRGTRRTGKVGIKLYYPTNKERTKWESSIVDDNQMATEDIRVADINDDGKLDIIAAGRASHNLKIYFNE